MSKINKPLTKQSLNQNTLIDHTVEGCPFKTAYGPKIKVQLHFPEQGRTKQSFKDECDINIIMGRYMRTGELPPNFNQNAPQYLDVTGQDFQEAMELVANAQSMFEELPSQIRAKFKNDAGAFLEFTSDPKNRQEMAQMGLLTAEATQSILNPKPASSSPATGLKNDSLVES